MSEKMLNSKMIGAWGEEKASEYLKKKGYSIIGLNYKIRGGEIDIIAKNRKYIVFAEIKTRKNANFATAREYVTIAKQRKIVYTASIWLAQNELKQQPRFDVLEVYIPDGISGKIEINHIENAFSEV